MSTINLSRNHSLPIQTIKDRLTALGAKLTEKYSAKTKWDDDSTLSVSGGGVDGKLKITADKVDVAIKLGMMARMFQGKIEETLSGELDKLVKG